MNITLKNISNAKIRVSIPSLHYGRDLLPGRVIPVSEQEYQEMMYDPGFTNLLNGHYLKFFGLDEHEQAAQPQEVVFERADISAMLEKLDVTAFAKFIPTATAAEKESVVSIAVDRGITNSAIVALVKKYCDVDLIEAISVKHQSEEK